MHACSIAGRECDIVAEHAQGHMEDAQGGHTQGETPPSRRKRRAPQDLEDGVGALMLHEPGIVRQAEAPQ